MIPFSYLTGAHRAFIFLSLKFSQVILSTLAEVSNKLCATTNIRMGVFRKQYFTLRPDLGHLKLNNVCTLYTKDLK